MNRIKLTGRTLAGLLFSCILAAMVAFAAPASAHAVVISTDPADGARLTKAPTSVTVTFDESVALNVGYLRVVDATGRRVDRGNASHPNGNGGAITVSLIDGLGDGGYLVSYRVVSADSHPIGGTVRFIVGNGSFIPGSASSNSVAVNRVVQSALSTSHGLAFFGLALLGGAWILFTIWPSGQRRPAIRNAVWAGWFTLLLGTVAELGLQGVYGSGGPVHDVLKWSLLDATLHDSTGQMLSFRLVLLGLLAGVLTLLLGQWRSGRFRRPAWGPEAAAILSLGVVVTFASSGHSQAANPRWFAVLVAALHVLAMALWLGGLVVLVLASRPAPASGMDAEDGSSGEDDRVELLAGLPIFSRVALGCIAMLAATGTIQAWRETDSIDALTNTLYGRLVLVKVALFFAIVVLGYLSRRVVLSRPTHAGALVQLRRSVLVEVVSAVAVLVATSVLIIQPPGKAALVIAHAKPRVASVALTASSSVRLQVSPGSHGPVQITLDITGGDTPLEVMATASLPAQQIGPIPIDLTAANTRSWTADSSVLPAAGDWQFTVSVRTSQFDSTTALATLHLY